MIATVEKQAQWRRGMEVFWQDRAGRWGRGRVVQVYQVTPLSACLEIKRHGRRQTLYVPARQCCRSLTQAMSA